MKEHRIITAGNSAAVTLAQDELDHLGLSKGDVVTIAKAKPNRLILRSTKNHFTLRGRHTFPSK